MSQLTASQANFAEIFDVSRETMSRLEAYAALLIKWNPKINLVAKSTIRDIWHRHMADSAQLWPLAPEGVKTWMDIGSGAGFPGLVIGAIAVEKAPDLRVTLVESDRRKSVFLQSAAREMGISVDVITQRIEKLEPKGADVLSARALSSLTQLLEFAEQHRNPAGICLFPKGTRVDSELTEASSCWHMACETFSSMTDPDAVILRIGEFKRV
ncbi:MAG: 16S rRNA (guanine(527)-N(7))-methyltransferase RsmG [Rhodobacteraceae bacterium]|nr:MAG: 16S rRNA (guanine(527)-N(7))-methyltransferase RsmG [Paracoccaceae bacterium]